MKGVVMADLISIGSYQRDSGVQYHVTQYSKEAYQGSSGDNHSLLLGSSNPLRVSEEEKTTES